MYITVRRYQNGKALADAMEAHADDVKKQISAVHGFVHYSAIRDGDGVTTVTVCNDKTGCDESTRVAGAWARDHVNPLPEPPEVSGGDVFLSF